MEITSKPSMSFRKDYPKLYMQIHEWVYKNISKPASCNKCDKKEKLEASNNSGKYTLSNDDWEWICHSCHAKKDKWGNLEKAHIARRGKTSWNKGKTSSEETKRKLSDSHKGKHHAGTFKKGSSPWTKGRNLSEEHKQKIGQSNKIAVKRYHDMRKLQLQNPK